MTLLERKGREYLDWQGFYHRKKVGFGHFITPEEIEERQPFDFYPLLKRDPFVTGMLRATGNDGIRMTSRGGGYCSPSIIVDGGGNSVPPVEAIIGVEIYKGTASVPLQYSFLGGDCGLVLIWTKG